MPRWTPEARQRQRELIQGFRPWESATGAKTTWGKFCASNNGYKSMPKLSSADEDRGTLISAAKGLLEILKLKIEKGFQPSEENLKDFRLALKVLYKFGAEQDVFHYGEVFKELVPSFEKGEIPPGIPNSDMDEDLVIAATALRGIIQQSLEQGKLPTLT
ncbi:hypothetical protein [Scytonema sp. PCC 10023]|uniref:hypothetical protein n=1 Tax=Scytonema sp. PCC 10023 TaxID=1680591 RepID=UPI0039C5DA7B